MEMFVRFRLSPSGSWSIFFSGRSFLLPEFAFLTAMLAILRRNCLWSNVAAAVFLDKPAFPSAQSFRVSIVLIIRTLSLGVGLCRNLAILWMASHSTPTGGGIGCLGSSILFLSCSSDVVRLHVVFFFFFYGSV